LSELAGIIVAIALIGGGFGLLVGSFLNVVAYRVPAGLSIVSPPSACPRCGEQIKPYDNVPVVSWLLLRAKCRSCREPISARYPLVELATGILFIFVALRFWPAIESAIPTVGSTSTTAAVAGFLTLIAFLYLAAISIALALIDLDTHTLPNKIVLPSYIVGAVLLGTSGILSGDYSALITAAVGLVALFALYFAMAIAYPGGMGFGDVKLAGVLGLYLGFLGWGPLVVGAFAAFLLGGIYAIALVVAGKATRKNGIPFGPWMLAGAWVGVFIGGAAWNGYLSLVGLT
jgi:leader peptidase (prepilin peptidase) / N-methyltransferase